MIFMSILMAIVVYIAMAIAVVFYIKRRTKKKILLWLAIIFVILFPTWDALLGPLVYYPACNFVPKIAIDETAETDSIYFEGLHNYYYILEPTGNKMTEDELIRIDSIYSVCHEGYAFAEALVVEKRTVTPEAKEKISPIVYKCIPLPKDMERPSFKRTSCTVVKEPTSRYMVKVRTFNVGTAEINLKKIYDRNTGKLMAEFNRVTLRPYAGLLGIPFFNWLDWYWGSMESGTQRCPPSAQEYEAFEYKVLRPRK